MYDLVPAPKPAGEIISLDFDAEPYPESAHVCPTETDNSRLSWTI
jgi:hypothetical protein